MLVFTVLLQHLAQAAGHHKVISNYLYLQLRACKKYCCRCLITHKLFAWQNIYMQAVSNNTCMILNKLVHSGQVDMQMLHTSTPTEDVQALDLQWLAIQRTHVLLLSLKLTNTSFLNVIQNTKLHSLLLSHGSTHSPSCHIGKFGQVQTTNRMSDDNTNSF